MLKYVRSFAIVNRIIALFLKKMGVKKLWSRWPLKGIVKIKIGGNHISFYSNCDDYLVSNLYYNGIDEEVREIEHLFKTLSAKSNGTFLDIGSYNGLFALAFSKKFPQSKIIAFEPNPVNYQRILKNIAINKLGNISLHNYGVSNTEQVLDFYIQADHQMTTVSSFDQSFTEHHSVGNLEKIKVDTIPLDSFCHQQQIHPDFIKVDVEGHELNVLRGAENIISKTKPIILCELFTKVYLLESDYKKQTNKIWLIEKLLRKYGYSFFLLGDKFQKQPSLNYNNPNRNWLFLPEKLI